jgi:hypothetical protein
MTGYTYQNYVKSRMTDQIGQINSMLYRTAHLLGKSCQGNVLRSMNNKCTSAEVAVDNTEFVKQMIR